MNGKTISHYRILGQIGEGGMGVVYVAEDTRLGRRVAIKIPHAGKDESHYRTRFLREARAVSKLSHRNIAAVYDLGETDDGQLYIVMELVSGQTLGDVLAGSGLSVARAVEVIREVADALSEAHSYGIIHRDIKPSNVIISDRGEVKVLDFGLAKQLDEDGTKSRALSEHTRSDVVIGTPLYLSPEQARGAKVDPRSDLFALGALLYECVSGRPAFSGANVIEIGAQVLHFDPPPPSRFNPRVTAEVDRLVKRALSKKPEDRFQNAKEFSDELTRLRARIPDSDSTRTRRLAGVESLARSSAFITMAETLRRPRFSPLTVMGAAVAIALVAVALYFALRPHIHTPGPVAVAFYEQGVEAMREGRYLKATELLNQAVAADREYALAHARLAEAWTELDYLDRANNEMLLASRLVPNKGALTREDALYYDAISATVTRLYPDAVKNYEELASLKADPRRLVDLGRAYVKNDESAKAVEAFMKAAGSDESYATAWVSLGAQHARAKNLSAATMAFDRAERLYVSVGNREGEAEVHYQRGRLLVEQGKKTEARRDLEQALAIAQSTGNVYQQVQALLQLAYVPDDLEQAKAYANKALDLAQSNGMQNLAARGSIDLGAQYLSRRLYDEADRFLTRGLEFARDFKSRRLESLAQINLASLRAEQGLFDEAVHLAEQARDYYKQNGFRREEATASLLLARIKGRQGDYEGARVAFEELIRANESSADTRLLAMLHRDCGSVLAKQDHFAEAIEHYRKTISIAKTLPDNTLLAYSLLNIAGSFWQLGHYDEANQALKEFADMVAAQQISDKDMLRMASLIEASIALSQGRFGDARAKGGEVLADMKASGGRRETNTDADVVVCLAETLGGAPARGRPMCDEAALLAVQIGDPLFVSNTKIALAEALLEMGDASGARAQALDAEAFFARSGRVESDWRALVIAGKACRLAGNGAAARDYFARAAAQLTLLEKSLGDAAAGYFSRQDVQRLRRELGGDAVAEAR